MMIAVLVAIHKILFKLIFTAAVIV